jgi:hypothetical protein
MIKSDDKEKVTSTSHESSRSYYSSFRRPTSPLPIKLFHRFPTLPRSFPKLLAQSCQSDFVSLSFSSTNSTSRRSSSVVHSPSFPPSCASFEPSTLWRIFSCDEVTFCKCKVWKSDLSNPKGRISGANRRRLGVLGKHSFSSSSSSPYPSPSSQSLAKVRRQQLSVVYLCL